MRLVRFLARPDPPLHSTIYVATVARCAGPTYAKQETSFRHPQISAHSQMIKASLETAVDRTARIAAIRREIAAGTYETSEKLSGALDRFLQDAEEGNAADKPPSAPRPR